jgi:hypothetical protein
MVAFAVILLEQVYGVSSKPVLSYIERPEVDDRFLEALTSDKEVIVYGSSKQGKTALVSKYLPYDSHLLISLTPKTSVLDIYHTILSKAGVRISAGTTESRSSEATASVGFKVKAFIPLFGSGEGATKAEIKGGSDSSQQYEEVPINLELPQHVADLLKRVKCEKWVILENFHYLNDDIQRQFAFDLRAFQELGVRFVILGVWREKNRMVQFNGDLLDRIIEIPVEPWKKADFMRVVDKGSQLLNISIAPKLSEAIVEASFASIGVFQELLKAVCATAGVSTAQAKQLAISDPVYLQKAVVSKANDYAARHQRALEAIAAGHERGGPRTDRSPLYLPYYLVRVILVAGYDGIASGMRRGDLHEEIRVNHHRGNDVRASDISNLLHGLANLQAVKAVSPPIIDYDQQNRLLQVVDSTFYFFIKNADLNEILSNIPNPLSD